MVGLPFVYPDPLETWSHVGIVSGVALLVETLALIVVAGVLRRRAAVRRQWIWTTLPLLGSVGSFGFAVYAHHQYWYYTTQRDVVVGPHGSNTPWWNLTQQAINQIRPYGIATIVGMALLLLLGLFLVARWIWLARGRSGLSGEMTPQPA